MSRRVARPYAAALFQVMERQSVPALGEAEEQLDTVAQLFTRHPELLRVFEVPSVSAAKKRELLATLGRSLALRVEAQRLLAALVQHFRLRFLPEVVAAFRERVDGKEGVVRGVVELPAPGGAEQLDALAGVLQGMVGSRVTLASRVRPELLAGFVVRLGSRVFDGSLNSQLARFTRTGQQR